MKVKNLIVGGGLAGLSLAYFLKKDCEIFEKENTPGGLCRTDNVNGFYFDHGGHVLHYKNSYTPKLLNKLLSNNLINHTRKAYIHIYDKLIHYPFQCNTFELPTEVKKDCIKGFVERDKEMMIDNFQDWIMKHFGEGISKHFMIPYNKKLWGIHPKKMTTDWVGFVPKVTLDDILEGALNSVNQHKGYNVNFYYPKIGGIEAIVDALLKRIKNPNLNMKLTSLNPNTNEVVFNDDITVKYENLISTIPLTELVGMISIKNKLKCRSILNVRISLKKDINVNKHWIYVPEKKYPFYRLVFPRAFSKNNVPKNKSSILAEIGYNGKIVSNKIIKKTLNLLIEMKLIDHEDVENCTTRNFKYGYVIFDHNRKRELESIKEKLPDNIYLHGRFGSWKYLTMEQVILESKKLAEVIK